MWIARDQDSTISFFNIKPYRSYGITGEWKSLDSKPLYITEKKYKDDGSYYYDNHQMKLPDEINNITWNDEPIEVTIVADSNGTFYVCRDQNKTLNAFAVMPHRNLVNPWWSAPDRLNIQDDTLFNDLTWDDEPIKANFKIKK